MQTATHDAVELFHEGTLLFSEMESHGMRIDEGYLKLQLDIVREQIKDLEANLKDDEVWELWKKRYGAKANLGSVTQLAEILFKTLGYKCTSVTEKTGRMKADEAAILAVPLDFCKDYISLKKLWKCRALLLEIQRETVNGYIHPFFNLAGGWQVDKKGGAETYRGSSNSPNFNNMPIRNQTIGKIIRRCFIAPDGYHLCEPDYSGIEVRVAACYNKDPVLIKYIKDPTTDMHRDTAADLFFLSQDFLKEQKDWAKKGVRDWAKNRFVFPEFYGSVFFQCAPNIWEAVLERDRAGELVPGKQYTLREHLRKNGIQSLGDCIPNEPPAKGTFEWHVQKVEKSFWNERFIVYTQWKKKWWDSYVKHGGFTTLTGFCIHGVYKRNYVINCPVQGSAFHCLLLAGILLNKWLKKHRMKSYICYEIHDSLGLCIYRKELQDVLNRIEYIMTVVVPKMWNWIIVPLSIEIDVCDLGASWFEKRQWTKQGDKWAPK